MPLKYPCGRFTQYALISCHFLLPFAALSPLSANAESTTPEQLLVTATYLPVESELLSSSISVINEQTLRASNKSSVLDMLRTVPGLMIERQGGPGGVSSVYIQGADSNLTLIMIDGLKMNDPLNSRGGSFDFSNLDINAVQRIEIVRGPQSAIYGSDALAGVINIITYSGSGNLKQHLGLEVAEHTTHTVNYRLSGSNKGLAYSVQLAQNDGGDAVEGSSHEATEINAKLSLKINNKNNLHFNFRLQDADRSSFPEFSGGPKHALSRILDEGESLDRGMVAGWETRPHKGWRSRLEASRYDREDDIDSPGVFVLDDAGILEEDFPATATENTLKREQWRWVNTIGHVGSLWANVGVDRESERSESSGQLFFKVGTQKIGLPTDYDLRRDNDGVFINLNYKRDNGLLLSVSARHDNTGSSIMSGQRFNSESNDYSKTHNLGLKYTRRDDSASFYLNWGEAYKLPSAFALASLTGNPDLSPETAKSWNMGLDYTFSANVTLSLGYFDNEYTDLVDFDDVNYRFLNQSSVETSGALFKLKYAVNEYFRLGFNSTYVDIDLAGNGSKLEGRPQWLLGSNLLWSINGDWALHADYQWVDERFSSSAYPPDSTNAILDDYHRIDMHLRYTASKKLGISISADNLLDESYEEAIGFPSPGRTLRLGASYSF